MDQLQQSWTRAWNSLSLPAPPGLFERLVAAYGEPQRRYHTLQHLQECLQHFESARALAAQAGEVELALWFHDAIYALRGKDNELRSAEWAVRELAAASAPPAVQARVRELVLATRHDAVPSDPDQQLLVDVDLAILGAAPARFAEYDAQVREEYSWVPGILYRMKRREVLRGFLERPSIYGSAHFRERFEVQARANLAGALA